MIGFRNIIQPRGSVVAVANQDETIDLANGVQTLCLMVALSALLTITAPVTSILGTGSLTQAVRIRVLDAGRQRVDIAGGAAMFLANALAPSAVSETLVTTTANQTTTLKSQFPVWFSSPFAANPMEAAFLETDPTTKLQFSVYQRSANPLANIVTGGAATLGPITAKVSQKMQFGRTSLPFYIPTMREVSFPVTGANVAQDFFLNVKLNKLRGIILTQDSDAGTVNDIIQASPSVSLLGDNGVLIGPNQIDLDQLAESQEWEFGGNVYPPTNAAWLCSQRGARLFFNFQAWGRLTNLLNPLQYTNLRFNMNVNTSAQTGATNSIIRVTLLEMERPAAVGGRQLVAALPKVLQG